MRLSLRAAVIAAAILWGGAMLLVGSINFVDPNYATVFLQMTNSVYPWFHDSHSISSLLGRALLGALDGAIAGILFAWLYNCFAGSPGTPASQH